MARTVGETIKGIPNVEYVVNAESNRAEPVEAYVNHRFREEMILPYAGITPNIAFLMACGERWVTTSDRIHCKVVELEERHICDLEDKIRSLYSIEPYDFIKRWYGACKRMDSMTFVYIKLKKD